MLWYCMNRLKYSKEKVGIALFSMIILISISFSGCISNVSTIRESNVASEIATEMQTTFRGQSFIVGCNGPSGAFYITSVKLPLLYRIGDPGDIMLEIRAMGDYWVPSDVVLSSGSASLSGVPVSTSLSDAEWIDISVTPVKLIDDGHYCYIFRNTGPGTVRYGYTTSSAYCPSDARALIYVTDHWGRLADNVANAFTIWGYDA